MKRFLLLILSAVLFCFAAGCGAAEEAPAAAGQTQDTAQDETDAASDAATVNVFDDLYGMDKQWFTALKSVDLEGTAVDATLFEDHPLTLITFWATWCGYCIEEMPVLQALAEEYAEQGFQVVGVLVDFQSADGLAAESEQEAARGILAEMDISYRNLADTGFLLDTDFRYITSVPHAYFVDEEGRFLFSEASGSKTAQISGSRTEEAWREMIEELLPGDTQ